MAVGGQRHNIPAPRFITRDQAHAVGKTIAVDHHDPAPSVYRYAAPVDAATVAGINERWPIEAGRSERPFIAHAPEGDAAPSLIEGRQSPHVPFAQRGPGKAGHAGRKGLSRGRRSEEHTSELQSLMRISYADFC